MKILWCVTGAGQDLTECFKVIEKIKKDNEITVVLSAAGEEVIGMYGINIPLGINVVCDSAHGKSAPLSGSVGRGEYDVVIIAPATANTVAKIVHGIADTIVTNIVAQAGKGKVTTLILPTDRAIMTTTTLPITIDDKKCRMCNLCKPIQICKKNAIYRKGGEKKSKPGIDLIKCNACKKCIDACKYNAISFERKTEIHTRDIDLKNTKRLKEIKGIHVLSEVEEVLTSLRSMQRL